MKRLVLTIYACIAIYCVQAQSFITINNDPVVTAMGGVGASASASGFSIYNNTASAALSANKWEVAYSYSPYMWNFSAGNNLHSVAGYYKLSTKHSLAAGVRYFNKANVMLISDDGESSGQALPWDISVEIGYAFKINDLMGVAANLRYIHSDMDISDMKGGAIGFDVGYYMHKNRLSLGVMLSNIGSKIDFGADKYDTPSWVKAGASYELPIAAKHTLTGAVQLDYNFKPKNEDGFSSGLGIEYSYAKNFFLRGGYRFASDFMDYSYATMGIGANIGLASLNFTYIVAGSNDPINKTMLMSVGVKF